MTALDAQAGAPSLGEEARAAAADRSVMARTLAYVFAVGSTLAVVSLALPSSVDVPNVGVAAPLGALAAVATAALLAVLVLGAKRLRAWAFHLVLACGTLLVSAAIYWSNNATSTYPMLYVPIALYAAYFFTPREAAVQVGVAAASYAVVLLASDADHGSVAAWLLTVGTLATTAALVRTMRDRLERLIGRLSDAARTDVLTGLLNRRGFQELFGNELERATRSNRPLSLIVGDIDHFKDLNDRFGHRAGDDALERLASVLRAAKRRIDTAARVGGEEFALIVPETEEHDAYVLAERLRRAVREQFEDSDRRVTISFGVASFPKHGRTAEALFHAGDLALYAAKELGRDRTVIHNPELAGAIAGTRRRFERDGYLATVLALAEALEARESGSATHSRRVARYAELIARELGLGEEVVDRVRIGGVLHDVGKIGVPESILSKNGPLSEEEWEELKRHPLIAARILDSGSIEDIRAWVLAHHERFDGTGYPHGLAGEEIPMEARILSVADAWEAMTSDRPYRRALTTDEARAELLACSGSQFDSEVVRAFLRVLDGSDVESLVP
ncbi:MAG TPA: diguanylate cyclase [Thermoleophilaceae bacterium]